MTTEERILEMMRITREMSAALANAGLPILASAHLTRKDAEAMVHISARFLAGVGHLRQAVIEAAELDDLDPAVNELAAGIADHSREFGATFQSQAIDQLRRLGGNARLVLFDSQKQNS